MVRKESLGDRDGNSPEKRTLSVSFNCVTEIILAQADDSPSYCQHIYDHTRTNNDVAERKCVLHNHDGGQGGQTRPSRVKNLKADPFAGAGVRWVEELFVVRLVVALGMG